MYKIIPKKKKSQLKIKGKKNFQPKTISWSNLNLGKLARKYIKIKTRKAVLKKKQQSPDKKLKKKK